MTEARQSRVQSFAFVIAASACVLFTAGFMASSLLGYRSALGGYEIEIDEKINPNEASVASLVRLPGIGIGRAETIVAYREDFTEKDSESRPFRDCNDLQKVRGIGPKTVQNMSQWLKFE